MLDRNRVRQGLDLPGVADARAPAPARRGLDLPGIDQFLPGGALAPAPAGKRARKGAGDGDGDGDGERGAPAMPMPAMPAREVIVDDAPAFRSHNARWTDDAAEGVWCLLMAGVSASVLGSIAGVTRQRIWQVAQLYAERKGLPAPSMLRGRATIRGRQRERAPAA